ncbi:MAG: hypothetical protein R6U04_02450 [Bacteroidales bacterium]
MIIENKTKSLRISQQRFLAAIIFFPLIVVLLATDLIEDKFLELNKYYWAIIATVIYLGQNVYEHLKDFNYIYFSDEEDNKLLLRYVSLKPFDSKKYSIEIKKEDLHSYKINRKSLNFKQELVLFVRTPQGIAKYPPISISALSEGELNQMKKVLNQILGVTT